MRVGVGGIHHQTVRHSFGCLELQSVVGRNTFSPPEIRVGIETDERSTQSRISVGTWKRSDRCLHLLGHERIGRKARGRRKNGSLEPVRVNLAVDRVRRCGDTRLVKWYRYWLMDAMISDVG